MPDQQRKTTPPYRTSTNLPDTNLEKVVDYAAYDVNGERLGKVTAIWTDDSGEPAFLGIRTSWLLGKTHIVPAYSATVNHQEQIVQLPYTDEHVKNAPSYDPEATLDRNTERQVCDYYRACGGPIPQAYGTQPAQGTGSAANAPSAAPETTVQLHEEQVRAGKRQVEAGGVRLRKIVRTETVQKPVEVMHEDVVVERVPAGERTPSKDAFQNKEFFIPLRREEATLEKETRVTGEVHARKTTGTERQTVAGNVRKEDVEIEDERRRKAA